jgi:WD40 repeat protein
MSTSCAHRFLVACLLTIGCASARPEAPRTDRLGDPLPAGAIARLGSARWQTKKSYSGGVALSPDGRTLVLTSAYEEPMETRAWEVTTGKPLWHVAWPPDEPRYTAGTLAFSADGRLLARGLQAVGLSDERSPTVTLYAARTGKELRRILATTRGEIQPLALSSDGKVLATAGGGYRNGPGPIVIWDVASGRELHRLKGHATAVDGLAFSADGRLLSSTVDWKPDEAMAPLTLPADPFVFIWDVATGQLLRRLPGRHSLILSPDGRLAAYREGESIRVDVIEAEKMLCRVTHDGRPLLFSPDGRRLATAADDEPLHVWDTGTGREVLTIPLSQGRFGIPVAFSADGALLATQTGGRARLWDVAKAEEIYPYDGHRGAVTCVAYAPDGRTIVTGGDDRRVRFWEAKTGRELVALPFPDATVRALAVSPDGTTAAAAGDDGGVRLFDVAAAKELHRFASPGNKPHPGRSGRSAAFDMVIRFLAFSGDGSTLVGCDNDDTTVVWDVRTKEELHRVRRADKEEIIGLSNDGAVVVTTATLESAGARRPLRMREAATGREISAIEGKPDEVFLLAVLSPDSKALAVFRVNDGMWDDYGGWAVSDPRVRVFEVATGREVVTLNAGQPSGTPVFSPDGGTVVTLEYWNNTVIVWDAATGRARDRFADHTGKVLAAAFSPDGRELVTVGDDGTALVWGMTSTPPDARWRRLLVAALIAAALALVAGALAGARWFRRRRRVR